MVFRKVRRMKIHSREQDNRHIKRRVVKLAEFLIFFHASCKIKVIKTIHTP